MEPTEEELALVNRQSRKELTAAEVYLFAVRLCDNEVDRDGEQFPQATLEQLAELFVGKSGIFDHRWSAGGQTARIYRTEVVREEGIRTALGEPACYLKGYAYMVRTQGNQDLIAEIEGGIKREVSVGCAVKRAECSICGSDMGRCAHEKGKRYDGRLCCARLLEATDAFEFSFVAVPAQPRAGVMKRAGGSPSLKQLALGEPAAAAELEDLERAAELGRRYLTGLRNEVVRLGLLAERQVGAETLRHIADRLEEKELLELRENYQRRAAERYPIAPQLSYGNGDGMPERPDGAFLICRRGRHYKTDQEGSGMTKVSFEEIGAVAATFFAQKEVKAGQVVKMTGNGQVGPCSAGDKFCGVALSNENGCAGVQVKGFCPVAVTGSIDLGWNALAADGAGGVQTATAGAEESPSGVECLVVSTDTAGKRAVICL